MRQGSKLGARTLALAGALLVGLALVVVAVLPLGAQTAISADGVVESTSGGFKFPDGTVQTTAAFTGSAPVEDTGQAGCWDESGSSIGCSGTGQDGELQRGVDWPSPRFTDNGDGTVTDNLTGLIWLELADCFGTRTWQEALSDANGLMSGQCGLTDGSVPTDWRSPNIRELRSLVDFGESSPAMLPDHPFTSVQSSFYWSSTSYDLNPSLAWSVDMSSGNSTGVGGKGTSMYVWPVRGGQ